MAKRRIFVAINLPEELKDKIEKKLEEVRYKFTNDVSFIERENWHITISFLGSQKDDAVAEAVKSTVMTAKKFSAPEIKLVDMSYGPTGKQPKMIWLNGDLRTVKLLAELKNDLEDDLVKRKIIFKNEYRQMRVHVTLARFERSDNLPDISSKLQFKFMPQSLDLMESELDYSGTKYTLLQRAYFKL